MDDVPDLVLALIIYQCQAEGCLPGHAALRGVCRRWRDAHDSIVTSLVACRVPAAAVAGSEGRPWARSITRRFPAATAVDVSDCWGLDLRRCLRLCRELAR